MPTQTAYELANASGCGVESEVHLFCDVGDNGRYLNSRSFKCVARYYFDEVNGWEILLPGARRKKVPWRVFELAMKYLRRSYPGGIREQKSFENHIICI